MMRLSLAALTVVTLGCDGTDPGNNNGNPDAPSQQVDAPPQFVPPAGYSKLISRTWSLAPGATDTYRCVRLTIPTDTYLTNIIAQAPEGTHHTVLSISDSGTAGPDGEYNCNVGELGMIMLYASGVGTSPLDFPSGVGVKIPAGSQIHLNLHLFNASDNPLTGDSGIWVKSSTTPPPTLAEMVFAGTTAIFLQSNNTPTTVTGTCNAQNDFTLFAVWPHMHQIAKHQKVEITHQGSTTTIHDLPYDFTEQNYYMKTPMVNVAMGDQIRVSCTYVNNTGVLVTVGDGSNQEMCFSGMYRYPARNAGIFECTSGPGL